MVSMRRPDDTGPGRNKHHGLCREENHGNSPDHYYRLPTHLLETTAPGTLPPPSPPPPGSVVHSPGRRCSAQTRGSRRGGPARRASRQRAGPRFEIWNIMIPVEGGGKRSRVKSGKHNQKAPEDVTFIREKTYTYRLEMQKPRFYQQSSAMLITLAVAEHP